MCIDNVKTIEELDAVLKFIRTIYPNHERFAATDFWIPHFNMNPELLLYAKDSEKICACALGIIDPLPTSKARAVM